jgi:hypothetical protein
MLIAHTYEGGSNENLKYFTSLFIEYKRCTITLFVYLDSIAFYTSVPAFRKCMNASIKKKTLLDESAATRAPPAAPLRRT